MEMIMNGTEVRSARKRNLQPHGIQASFGGKAKITEVNGNLCLESYGTIVALVDGDKLIRTWDGYSATTLRHVNAFMKECDLVADVWDVNAKQKCATIREETQLNKADWEKMYVEDADTYGYLPFN